MIRRISDVITKECPLIVHRLDLITGSSVKMTTWLATAYRKAAANKMRLSETVNSQARMAVVNYGDASRD